MSTYISNIKVTSQDVIKNWWKLNYVHPDNKFTDEGEGDVDFYTYWYSICYTVALLNHYRLIFRDINQYEQMLRRFLQSRNIAFINDSTIDVLKYIYKNWVEEIEKRGTILVNESKGQSEEVGLTDYVETGVIYDDIENNSGIGILSNAHDVVGIVSLGLGQYNTIQFDVLLSNSDYVQYPINGKLFWTSDCKIGIVSNDTPDGDGFAHYDLTYTCAGIDVVFTVKLNTLILNTIKFNKYDNKISLYINDIFIGSQLASYTGAAYYGITSLFNGVLPVVANLKVIEKDLNWGNIQTTTWKCNEGSGFTLESNLSPNSTAKLNISNDLDWGSVWVRDSRIVNCNYKGIDGELKRLLNYSGGEHLHELISTSEMGLVIDMSSPISEEASCGNLNKFPNKGILNKISQLPLFFNSDIKPYVSDGYINYNLPSTFTDFVGINSTLLDIPNWKVNAAIKPIGQIPFIPIPIASGLDTIDGYEISFVVKSDQNINIKFGILAYDEDLVLMNNTMKSTSNNLFSNMFMDVTDFSLCKNNDLWIRGCYTLTHLTDVAQKLNIGFGNNLYNILITNDVKYIVPIIAISNSGVDTLIQLKDFVLRPLSLDTSKGVVSNKNKIVSYIKNNSGQDKDNIGKFIDEKLIPYNCTDNIKYL